jgi:hypothetical protein
VTKDPERHERVLDGLRAAANSARSTADEMAGMWEGCDDPTHPFRNTEAAQEHYTNWREFARVVCAVIVDESNADVFGYGSGVQAAMRLYRAENPHYIATCLTMADATVTRLERQLADAHQTLDEMQARFEDDGR